MLSHTTGYAISALSRLQPAGDGWTLCKDIAAVIGAPQPYLSKILHRLRQSGLVVAKRGYRGGFALARPAERISLLEVADAVEGEGWLPSCMLGLPEGCVSGRCPTRAFWQCERDRIARTLEQTTLADVVACTRRDDVATETKGRAGESGGWPEADRSPRVEQTTTLEQP